MSAPAAIANAVADALGVDASSCRRRRSASGSCCEAARRCALERPRSLDEALALLAEHGDDAKLLAGGQSLVPLLNFRLAAPGGARRSRPRARPRR